MTVSKTTPTTFPTLTLNVEDAFEALFEGAGEFRASIAACRKSKDGDGDPTIREALHLGDILRGMRGVPAALTGHAAVEKSSAYLGGVPINDWVFPPEYSLIIQIFGAEPVETPENLALDFHEAAHENGLFKIAKYELQRYEPMLQKSPLGAAASVFSRFEGAVARVESQYDKMKMLMGVAPYVFASMQRLLCGRQLDSQIPVFAGGLADLYCQTLGDLIVDTRREKAVEFVKMYLTQLASHGANFSETRAYETQTAWPGFAPVHCIISGLQALGAPAHGGAQSDVLKMIESCKAYCEQHGQNAESLLAWGRIWKAQDLFYGFGHAVYRVNDPRGRRLLELAMADKSISDDENYKFLIWLLEEMPKMLTSLVPKMSSPAENVDFLAGGLQKAYLGIESPEALELLFGMARVAAYMKAGFLAHFLKAPIYRPDSLTIVEICETLQVENPFLRLHD